MNDSTPLFERLDHSLCSISFPGVERGDVVLMYNPYLCNWNTTVSYSEVNYSVILKRHR